MRLFFAVPLPDDIRKSIAARPQLYSRPRSLRWVKPANLHFTLRFLGEVSPEKIGEVVAAGEEAVSRNASFSLSIAACGFFPERGAPRVFWLGVAAGASNLVSLADSLTSALRIRGLVPEAGQKPFQPHLTVARLKGKIPLDSREQMVVWGDRGFGSFPVTRLVLFQSELTPDGPRYNVCHDFKL